MVSAEDWLNPPAHRSHIDKLVLATVNAPYKRSISAPTLKECLVNPGDGDWLVHVATFFSDVSPMLILGFAASQGISRPKLAQAYLVMKSKTGEQNMELEALLERMATPA